MIRQRYWQQTVRREGLLVDANLMVLLVVGLVNTRRIGEFKRLSSYTPEDYHLLNRLLQQAACIFTVAHIMSEVSNLTDLPGKEREDALDSLRGRLEVYTETTILSSDAARHPVYARLGLIDAALALAAERLHCAVLTDDLALHLALQSCGVLTEKFTHLRAALL